MPGINFINEVTHIPASWANDVDFLVYDVFGGATTREEALVAFNIGTMGTQDADSVTISGGSIEGTTIGAADPTTARFTYASVTAVPTDNQHLVNKGYVDALVISAGLLPNQAGNAGRFLTTNGTSPSWVAPPAGSLPSQTGQAGRILTTDGNVASWIVNNGVPSQSGSAGLFLTTNGSVPSWVAITANSLLPSQGSFSGRFLQTNGTDTSWGLPTTNSVLPSQAGHAGHVLTSDGTNTAWVAPNTAVGIPAGGSTNQVLTKSSGSDYAVTWSTLTGGSPSNLALGAITTTTVPVTNSNGTGFTLAAATGSAAGLMTATQFTKLAGIEDGATADMTGAEISASITTFLGGTTWQQGGGGASTLAQITDMTANARSFNAAANYAAMRTALGVVPGSDVDVFAATASQAEAEAGSATSVRNWTPQRIAQAIVALAPSGGSVLLASISDMSANARTFNAAASFAAMRTAISLVPGTDVQVFDAGLASIASLTTAANTGIYTTGADIYATYTLTAAGRTFLAANDAAAQMTSLGMTAIGQTIVTSINAAAVRTALAIVPGTDIDVFAATVSQAEAEAGSVTSIRNWTPQRIAQAIAALAPSGGSITLSAITDMSANARSFNAAANYAAMRTALGVVVGTDVQAFNAKLGAISGLTTTADSMAYFTGASTAAVTTVTTGGRALLNNAGTANTFPYYSASNVVSLGSMTAAGLALVAGASATAQLTTLGLTANGQSLVTAANYSAMRTLLTLVPGTDVQTFHASLASIAGLTTSANQGIYTTGSNAYATYSLSATGRSLVGGADAAAMRSTLSAQLGIQFQDEGSNLGTSGTVDTFNVSGGAGVLTRVGNVLTLTLSGGSSAPTVENIATGSAYTLVVGDANKIKRGVDTSPQTINITTAFNGLAVTIQWPAGSGAITLDANAGVNLNGLGDGVNIVLSDAGGAIDLIPTGTNTWDVVGAIGNLLSTDITDSTTIGRTILTAADAAAVRTATGLVIGTNVQAFDATLTAFAALTIAANSLTLGTGADAFTQTTFAANTFPGRASTGSLEAKPITDFGLSLVDDADATAARTTLGLVIGTNVQAFDATLGALAALTIAANSLTIGTGADAFSQTTFAANTFPGRSSTGNLVAKQMTDFGYSLVDDADASAARTTLGLVIGTNVQQYDAFLEKLRVATPRALTTTVTLGASDTDCTLRANSGSTFVITLANDATLTPVAGKSTITVFIQGTGVPTFAAGTATLLGTPRAGLAQNDTIVLVHTGVTDTWAYA